MMRGKLGFLAVAGLVAHVALTGPGQPHLAFGQEGPRYIIDALGLFDALHTRNDGAHEGSLSHTTRTGFAAGYSSRWDRDSFAGHSAWLYDSATGRSTRIGMIDPEGGERWSSYPAFLNDRGQVAGTTTRNPNLGGSSMWAWFYDPATTSLAQIGYYDDQHTRADGEQNTEVQALTGSGHAFGNSMRYDGTAFKGRSVWAYDSNRGTTTRIGFFDGEYADPDNGEQLSEFSMANSEGFATGRSHYYPEDRYSSRVAWSYNPTTSEVRRIGLNDPTTGGLWVGGNDRVLGVTENRRVIGDFHLDSTHQALWVHDDATNTTTRAGLFDGEHTSDGGRQYTDTSSAVWNSVGQVIGRSQRYPDPNSERRKGWSAWVFDPATAQTKRLGYTDAEHTKADDGSQENWATAINELGMVIGGARRWEASNDNGRTAWLYNPSDDTTKKLGDLSSLPGAGVNFHSNTALAINNRGQVVGSTQQTAGGLGQTMWMYDVPSDGMRQIGLYDALHTHPTGNYQEAGLSVLSDSGLVAGFTVRMGVYPHSFFGSGKTAWIYDFDADKTTPLVFSQSADGKADSQVKYISDDGIVIGKYELYSEDDGDPVMRPFIGTLDFGFFDVHHLVADGLAPHGWDRLAEDIIDLGPLTFERTMSLGEGWSLQGDTASLDWNRFAGMGYRLDGSYVPFAMRPVPEPSALALLGIGAIGLVGHALRRRRLASQLACSK